MGLRSTTATVGSTNAADMAPALTEPVSQAKISSPAAAASPRPEILVNNVNQEYLCSSTKQTTAKPAFEQEFGEKFSNGPDTGPAAVSHMDQPNDDPADISKDQHEENLPNIGEFIEINQPPAELVAPSTQQQQQQQQQQTLPSINSTMGLQKDYLKDNAEMEQMLGDLASSGEIDLMQVFKSFESVPASDNLCELAGGLSLFNDVDVMNMGLEYVSTPVKDSETLDIQNEIEKRQVQMMRKCDFLIRRLRKVQARYMGQHINEEINGLFDNAQQSVKRKDRGCKSISTMTPINLLNNEKQKQPQSCSMKSLIKRIDYAAVSCQQSSPKNKVGRPNKITSDVSNNCLQGKEATVVPYVGVVPDFDVDSRQQLEHSSALLEAAMKKVAYAIDSDATASSSGGESADEMISYNNSTQNSLTIAKRSAWRWARDRAAIAARCSWLLSQISDLEYRVRQHTELHQQIKKNKGGIQFVDGGSVFVVSQEPPPQNSVNGYRGTLPGNSKSSDVDVSPNGAFDAESTYGSCRTRAFQKASFKKRKLTQMTNLHTVSKKAAKPSTVKCGCQWPLHPCALCTGRQDPTAPRELTDTLSFGERVALLDPGFHPVVSFPEDVSQSIHFECTMRRPEWQIKASRSNVKTILKGALALQKQIEREGGDGTKPLYDTNLPKKYQKKYNILASSKLKKKAKKSKTNRHNSHLLHSNKHRKKSLNSTASDLDTLSGEGDAAMTANGALMPRSKTSSPTPGSSKHEKFGYYSDRKNKNSYDIDNIVIPYSVAASTRIEVLQCKEIPTPKWRVTDEETEKISECPSQPKDNTDEKEESEDISSDAIHARHERALTEERKKFSTFLKFPWSTRSRANRRIDSRAESSGANTPDRTSPAPKTPSVVGDHESIPSPAVPSPAAPSTPQTPQNDQNIDQAADVTALAASTPTGLSNSSIIPPSALKIERRRTVSLRKTLDMRDDGSRLSNIPEFREAVQPFDNLEFPLPDDLYESMLKLVPTLQDAIDEISQSVNTTTASDASAVDISKIDNNHSTSYVNDAMDDSDEETESVESGMIDEDPNDPEWCEPPSRT